MVCVQRSVPGGADRGDGVHGGRLAGLPPAVIARAWDLLAELESNGHTVAVVPGSDSGPALQLSLMPGPTPVDLALGSLDVANLTPLQAITELYRLQELAGLGDGGQEQHP